MSDSTLSQFLKIFPYICITSEFGLLQAGGGLEHLIVMFKHNVYQEPSRVLGRFMHYLIKSFQQTFGTDPIVVLILLKGKLRHRAVI